VAAALLEGVTSPYARVALAIGIGSHWPVQHYRVPDAVKADLRPTRSSAAAAGRPRATCTYTCLPATQHSRESGFECAAGDALQNHDLMDLIVRFDDRDLVAPRPLILYEFPYRDSTSDALAYGQAFAVDQRSEDLRCLKAQIN
jgi:hypothetical protein